MKTILFHLKINFVLKNRGSIKGNHHTLLQGSLRKTTLQKLIKSFFGLPLKATSTLFINTTVFYVF